MVNAQPVEKPSGALTAIRPSRPPARRPVSQEETQTSVCAACEVLQCWGRRVAVCAARWRGVEGFYGGDRRGVRRWRNASRAA